MNIVKAVFFSSVLLYLLLFLFYWLHSPSRFNKSTLNKERFQSEVIGKAFLPSKIPKEVMSKVTNPFSLLGSYPAIPKGYQEFRYKSPNYRIKNEQDYCERVDLYNLAFPDNIFEKRNFWTDFPNNRNFSGIMLFEFNPQELPSNMVMKKIGKTLQSSSSSVYKLDTTINNFFVQFSTFHYYHKIGSHFLCATQMYNQIPGQETLTRKDKFVNSVNKYTERYANRPQCFNESSLYPYTYRLAYVNECKAFFKKINSRDYQESLRKEAIQYVIKVGFGAHKSQGVFLLDKLETKKLNKEYNFGSHCGKVKKSLLAQTYISNPLLLDLNNKFDFRIYMLIASTNPLIVYYHDGFLKLSLNSYRRDSTDKATHLTNTFLAKQKIEGLKSSNETINGMTKKELEDYILWDFEKFQTYLLQSGKINDPNWLDNYLRPAFHRALIHLIRATKYGFWKQSNVYGLQGVDFLLDDRMQLWFIESNSSPLLTGTSKYMVYHSVLVSHFEIQYAYFRSRMKRTLAVIKKMQESQGNLEEWRREYQKAIRNRLEPEYQISSNNNFTLILDENYQGSTKAYSGYISSDCL